MIAIPAVDVREGACVQLVGGAYDQERVRLPDPIGVARQWAALGFRRLHVVDLDAATGRGANTAILHDIAQEPALDVQIGGGVRDEEAVARLLAEGARRVVVGTRALEDPQWLAGITARYPYQIVVAADVRDRCIVTRGWERTLPLAITDTVRTLNDCPLAAVLVTAVHREGQLQGPDLPLMAEVVALSQAPAYAAGGIATVHDLRALADHGVAAAIIGMALYTGAIDAATVAKEFAA